MKSSELGGPPPPPMPPQQPQLTPEMARALELERSFVAQVARRTPWATMFLVGFCVAVYLIQAFFSHSIMSVTTRADLLGDVGANIGKAVLHGQWWRLWAATFIHWNWMHIGMNMWALWILGPFVEKVLGSARFLVIYALCGLAGSVLGTILHPAVMSGGASGAIWGIFTAAYGLALRPGNALPPLTAHGLKRKLVMPLVLNAGISLLPEVDGMAHLGGAVVGFVLVVAGVATLGMPGLTGGKESEGSRTFWNLSAAVLCFGMLISIGKAITVAFSIHP